MVKITEWLVMTKRLSDQVLETAYQELARETGDGDSATGILRKLEEFREKEKFGVSKDSPLCGNTRIYKFLERKGHLRGKKAKNQFDQRPDYCSPINPFPIQGGALNGVASQRPACFYCKYWRVAIEDLFIDEGGVKTECRRYPPVQASPIDHFRIWPDCKPFDWCGEFDEVYQETKRLHPKHFGLFWWASLLSEDKNALILIAGKIGPLTYDPKGVGQFFERLHKHKRQKIYSGLKALSAIESVGDVHILKLAKMAKVV